MRVCAGQTAYRALLSQERSHKILHDLFANFLYDCLKSAAQATAVLLLPAGALYVQRVRRQLQWIRGASLVSRRNDRSAIPASCDDPLDAIVKAAVDSVDWKAELAFRESLGRPDLSEQELYAFLRAKGFGRQTVWDRLHGRTRISLEEAFAARSNFLTPLEAAVNEIVWRVDRKWICPTPNMEIRPRTAEQRIDGYAILRVVRRLYGLDEHAEIWFSLTPLETTYEAYHVRLYIPGVSSVREFQQLPLG
jgi:hypothetical protein